MAVGADITVAVRRWLAGTCNDRKKPQSRGMRVIAWRWQLVLTSLWLSGDDWLVPVMIGRSLSLGAWELWHAMAVGADITVDVRRWLAGTCKDGEKPQSLGMKVMTWRWQLVLTSLSLSGDDWLVSIMIGRSFSLGAWELWHGDGSWCWHHCRCKKMIGWYL